MGSFLSGRKRDGVAAAAGEGPALAMPDDLDLALQVYWDRVVAQLPAGVATDNDQRLIVQLCEALYVQAQAWEDIKRNGISTVDEAHGGELRRNPAIITWRQAADMARQCMALLGLSPVSRARMASGGESASNEFLKFLQRRHEKKQG